jgi:hypothetical protein
VEYGSGIKKNRTVFSGNWVELENIMFSEVSSLTKTGIPCFLSDVSIGARKT